MPVTVTCGTVARSIAILKSFLATARTESVTRIVNAKLPVVAGLPVTEPPLGLRVNPAGIDPLSIDHVYGGSPPVAASGAEYATPQLAGGRDDSVVIVRPAVTLTVKDRVAFADSPSDTCIVKLKSPAAVGLPVMSPLDGFNARPGGNDPVVIDQLYGDLPPLTFSVCEYDAPTTPLGSAAVVIVRPAVTVMLSAWVALFPSESLARIVKKNVLAWFGVPVISPEDVSANPDGRFPSAIDHVYGDVPPVADNDCV